MALLLASLAAQQETGFGTHGARMKFYLGGASRIAKVKSATFVADVKDARFESYEIEVENEESIHAHNAYAYLKRP